MKFRDELIKLQKDGLISSLETEMIKRANLGYGNLYLANNNEYRHLHNGFQYSSYKADVIKYFAEQDIKYMTCNVGCKFYWSEE